MQVKINVKLFHKEPDMKCWNCNKLISHKNVKWKPRTYLIDEWILSGGNKPNEMTEDMKQQAKILEKELGKERQSSPNQIFGGVEYEYRGQCPECNVEITLFWFGDDSIKRNKNKVIAQTPFSCPHCKTPYWRIKQVWYSIAMQKGDERTEYLVNLCPKCKTELVYPLEYDLEHGIIK